MENVQQPHNRVHMWIIVLLVWTLLLVLFGIGYQLYGKSQKSETTLTPEELASACADAVNDRLQTGDKDSDPTTCTEQKNGEVTATASHPGFAYPDGWHVFGRAQFNNTDLQTIVYITPEPIFLCADCDMLIPGVTMTVQSNATAESYIAEYTDEEFGAYANVTSTTETRLNGTLTTVKGDTTENSFGGPGIFETYIFVGEDQMAVVRFDDLEGSTDDDVATEDWSLIKNSLDFSKIE